MKAFSREIVYSGLCTSSKNFYFDYSFVEEKRVSTLDGNILLRKNSQKNSIYISFYLISGEEELQLQLALAMSREEAEQEETKSKSDDMRLQLALQKSKEEGGPGEQQGLG